MLPRGTPNFLAGNRPGWNQAQIQRHSPARRSVERESDSCYPIPRVSCRKPPFGPDMSTLLTEPPIRMIAHGQFHSGQDAAFTDGPLRRRYQHTSKQVAFRAMTSRKTAGQLVYEVRIAGQGIPFLDHQCVGAWLVADALGTVTAHRGLFAGEGGPWELADSIVPGSAHAVRTPVLTGYYRERPEAYLELVSKYETSVQWLRKQHDEALSAGNLYATMQIHSDPDFLGLLSAAVTDRATQLVLHDWLTDRGFPHANELRSKRWNQGKWTENQLLDLLSKPFTTERRSYSGRSI